MMKELASQMCSGLKALHCKELIHNNLTPKNWLLGKAGNKYVAKLSNFRYVCEAGKHTNVHAAEGYMAPEHLWGNNIKVSYRSEIRKRPFCC